METMVSTTAMLPKRILVGLDGSAGSARALAWALELAPIDLPDDWLDDLRGRFENEWTASLRQAGVVSASYSWGGQTASELASVAAP